MYHKNSAIKGVSTIGSMATTGSVIKTDSVSLNQLPIISEIDHYILSSSLALGSPFSSKTITPTDSS
jgi:hypothetical protein